MAYSKKKKPNKPHVQAAKKKKPVYVPDHVKIHRLLKQGKNPTITFLFRPHGLKATAKNAKGNLKRIPVPTKQVTLNDVFLHDYKGRRKSPKRIVREIREMAHDEGATKFVI